MAQSKKDSNLRAMLLNSGAVRNTDAPVQIRSQNRELSREQAIAARRHELGLDKTGRSK